MSKIIKCNKCKKNAEYYMLCNETWGKASQNNKFKFLCLSCVTMTLKRPLNESDFIDAPINKGVFGFSALNYLKGIIHND